MAVLDSLLRQKANELSRALNEMTNRFADDFGVKPAREALEDNSALSETADQAKDPDGQSKVIGPADAWPQADSEKSDE